jgi:hypothetical protein
MQLINAPLQHHRHTQAVLQETSLIHPRLIQNAFALRDIQIHYECSARAYVISRVGLAYEQM